MRFPFSFTRYVGTDLDSFKKELGKDKLPESMPADSGDFIYESRFVNINGFPLQRVPFGVHGPDEAIQKTTTVTVAAYIYEDVTKRWYLLARQAKVIVGTLIYFDPPALMDTPQVKAARVQTHPVSSSAGALEMAFIVTGSDKLPKGEYVFIAGSDVSNPG
jgi:hypothetical protein